MIQFSSYGISLIHNDLRILDFSYIFKLKWAFKDIIIIIIIIIIKNESAVHGWERVRLQPHTTDPWKVEKE